MREIATPHGWMTGSHFVPRAGRAQDRRGRHHISRARRPACWGLCCFVGGRAAATGMARMAAANDEISFRAGVVGPDALINGVPVSSSRSRSPSPPAGLEAGARLLGADQINHWRLAWHPSCTVQTGNLNRTLSLAAPGLPVHMANRELLHRREERCSRADTFPGRRALNWIIKYRRLAAQYNNPPFLQAGLELV